MKLEQKMRFCLALLVIAMLALAGCQQAEEGGEEEKSEVEPLKILGKIQDGKFVQDDSIKLSAHCNRVPVVDGHTACVSLEFANSFSGGGTWGVIAYT